MRLGTSEPERGAQMHSTAANAETAETSSRSIRKKPAIPTTSAPPRQMGEAMLEKDSL